MHFALCRSFEKKMPAIASLEDLKAAKKELMVWDLRIERKKK